MTRILLKLLIVVLTAGFIVVAFFAVQPLVTGPCAWRGGIAGAVFVNGSGKLLCNNGDEVNPP